jgi:hypothetical protein
LGQWDHSDHLTYQETTCFHGRYQQIYQIWHFFLLWEFKLTFLSYMGLSYNNFTWRIPSGSQAWHPTFCKSVNVYWPSAGASSSKELLKEMMHQGRPHRNKRRRFISFEDGWRIAYFHLFDNVFVVEGSISMFVSNRD